MWFDPILEETRGVRESYALEHNHDIDAIFRDIQKRQSTTGRKLVSRPPRKPRIKLNGA